MLGYFQKDESWQEFPPVFTPVPVVLLKDIPTGWEDDKYEAGTELMLERVPTGRLDIMDGRTCIKSDAEEDIDFWFI